MGRVIVTLALLAGIGFGVWGFIRGVPERDIGEALRHGDRARVKAMLDRDPWLAMAKVYPQGLEPWQPSRRVGINRVEWRGRYLLHDTVDIGGDPQMLALLAGAGADLGVRLEGRTLLHEAARHGNRESASWLLDHGAAIDEGNDCAAPCTERGRTALHHATAVAQREMVETLLARGARVDAQAGDGQTALHLAAAAGAVDTAWELCRYGADITRADGRGRLPRDVADAAPLPGEERGADYGPGAMAQWLASGGGCETLANRARATGQPVDEDEGRVVFATFLCARGRQESCAPAP